ncbi:hypothetical protein L7H23_05990 [Sphingopyxis sp. BSN-002]|uniref:hypothetical protein n=1 Tax=Sphingopyxis sp. BSN-002 TaxID=2911495 RepID=UPI001EDA137B|nr:hypothetical protein [Sphingopyxis sp. BSN-002]UKK85656.1 hypothetical protein L7H23_05990 [Sphingopyxis sp. BSN-002]
MAKTFRLLIALAGTALTFVGAPAFAAENLVCVDSGYSVADEARMDGFVSGFDLVAWGKEGPPADIMQMIVARADVCSKLYGWSDEATRYAVAFKMARVGLAGSERNGVLDSNQIAGLQKSITREDVQKGKLVFGQMANAYRQGSTMLTESPDMFIGRLILRSGVPAERAAAAGGWIGATILCAHFTELFDAA